MENDGNKSFQNLLSTIYNSKTGNGITVRNGATLPSSYPVAYTRNGYFSRTGSIAQLGITGFTWSKTMRGYLNYVWVLEFDNNAFAASYNSQTVIPGLPLRCLAR